MFQSVQDYRYIIVDFLRVCNTYVPFFLKISTQSRPASRNESDFSNFEIRLFQIDMDISWNFAQMNEVQ